MEQNYKTVSALLFPEKATHSLSASQKFDEELRRQYQNMNIQRTLIYDDSTENYQEIANFIRNHVLNVGKKQAVKDFQCGLNFLHKGLEVALKEDGEFGEKTFNSFYQIFKYYDVEVVKNAVRKGAISNAVIGTASNKNVNTHNIVRQIERDLGEIFHE